MGTAKNEAQEKRDKVRSRRLAALAANTLSWFNPTPADSDKKWLDDNPDALGALVEEVLSGLSEEDSLTLKYDAKSSRFTASLFLRSQVQHNAVPVVAVRGKTAYAALVYLAYAHVKVYRRNYLVSVADESELWG